MFVCINWCMYTASLSLAKCALGALEDVDTGETETASNVSPYADSVYTVMHGHILNVHT